MLTPKTQTHTLEHDRAQTLRAALGALALGAVILAVVGFAPQPAFHNAAHDTRHVAVFPCH